MAWDPALAEASDTEAVRPSAGTRGLSRPASLVATPSQGAFAMRFKHIIPVFVPAAAVSVPAVSLAAPAPGSTICTDNSLAGQKVTTNVTVPAGARCDLSWADVQGNVAVSGDLVTFGQTHFAKNVSVTGGSFA